MFTESTDSTNEHDEPSRARGRGGRGEGRGAGPGEGRKEGRGEGRKEGRGAGRGEGRGAGRAEARGAGRGQGSGAERPEGFAPEGEFGPSGAHFGPRGRRGRAFGRPGGWQQADLPAADDAAAWFAGRLPGDWFTGAPQVTVDREEILVIGTLTAPVVPEDSAGSPEAAEAAATGRISRFREQTRDERIAVAAEAEARYGRKVAWGAQIGDTRVVFSHLAVPVMTRLRQPERRVLDTLVDAGVARSRSEALSWSVRVVGEHTDEWLSSLREAMSEVDKLRTQGPEL